MFGNIFIRRSYNDIVLNNYFRYIILSNYCFLLYYYIYSYISTSYFILFFSLYVSHIIYVFIKQIKLIKINKRIYLLKKVLKFLPKNLFFTLYMMFGFFSYLFLFCILTICVNTHFFQIYSVSQNSMVPTLKPTMYVIVDKISFGFIYKLEKNPIQVLRYNQFKLKDIKRNDIIVFYNSNNVHGLHNELYVKRIIGKPNDMIEFKKNKFIINKSQVDLTIQKNVHNLKQFFQKNYKIHVPEGHYFVLGDNYAYSNDSRNWGFLPKHRIIGKVMYAF